jgi:magnesium-transporting ATPase (P-type)
MKQLSLFPGKQTRQTEFPVAIDAYWTLTTDQLLFALHTTLNGLQKTEAENRIRQYGPNTLKAQRQTTAFGLLLSQFKKAPGSDPDFRIHCLCLFG